MGWRKYWENDTSLYVNDRHKRAHYEALADDYLRQASATGLALSELTLLDFGCGEALSARRIADQIGTLVLYDRSEHVSRQLDGRFGAVANISVLRPQDLGLLPVGSIDLVVVNSVLQYVDPETARALLADLAGKLSARGRMIIADILPPDLGTATDVVELLRFAAGKGFLLAALVGLVRSALSDYARTRARIGLTRYSNQDFDRMAASAGLSVERLPRNIGHNPHRMAFVARPKA